MMEHWNLEVSYTTDTELVEACLEENQEALSLLYQDYFTPDQPVYFWVYRKAHWIPYGEKADALNDIYLAVLESLPKFEFRSALHTYIVRIAKMICLDRMPSRLGLARGKGIRFVDIDRRKSDGEPVVQVEGDDPEGRPDHFFEALEEEERVFLLQTVLTRYTGPRCRKVLQLHIRELREEITREDVAEELGVPVERAGHMIYDCLYRLRQHLKKKFRDYQHFSDCVYNRGRMTGLHVLKKESK